jgi:hypothetical protein
MLYIADNILRLHICKERSPASFAVMSERCDADCVALQQMRNGAI